MSIHDETQASNELSKKDIESAKNEHLLFLEEQRVASEKAMQNSVKGNWDNLNNKRKTQQVFNKIPGLINRG